MKKDRVLRSVVMLQAVCMIVLTVVVITRVLSPADSPPADNDKDDGGEPGSHARLVAATVGGDPVLTADLEEQLRLQYGDAMLRTLMVRAAIRLEAAASGLVIEPAELQEELDAMMAGYEDQEHYYTAMKDQLGLTPEAIRADTEYRLLLEKIAIRPIHVTDAEVDDYIEANKAEFAPQTRYRLAWIVSENKREANDVLKKLTAGEDFALMARTYSIDQDTADDGGDLGLVDADDPFFESDVLSAAEELDIGEMAGPVPVQDGQAVIQLLEKQESKLLDASQIREIARKQLALSKADSLQSIEDALLKKYNATITPTS
ncbi:peptidyl-prolyl cis-trans isomerase [Paenibacillus mendelii]|uniref:peptidylprolyl isomerase n=1 Tax=Paenibacillus mendelii TaxID=206163 RepID=A0ABV6JJ93_9BACL|nr:peptidyl-prolyl cis-trans isomerase [Paenibacillus mendelii]MCQ6563701.1 peptidyl-prolyl cis-trans isomerase [Paenibacillus mendelii]